MVKDRCSLYARYVCVLFDIIYLDSLYTCSPWTLNICATQLYVHPETATGLSLSAMQPWNVCKCTHKCTHVQSARATTETTVVDRWSKYSCCRQAIEVRVRNRPTINMEIPTAKYGKTTKNMEKYGKNTCYNEG